VAFYLAVPTIWASIVVFSPVNVCSPDIDKYQVTYKLPKSPVDDELVLIASLSNYKLFKRSSPQCDEKISKNQVAGINLIAIHDSAIAKLTVMVEKI